MKRRTPSLLVLPLVAALVPACSDASSGLLGENKLDDQDKEEVARSLAAALSRSFSSQDGVASAAMDLARGDAPEALAPPGSLAREPLGLTVDIDVSCADERGAAMDACGPAAASASLSARVAGELSLLGWTGTIDISVDWQLSGLLDEEVAVEGSADIELTSEFEDWFRPVTHSTSFTVAADVSATVRRSDHVVTSGSAELSVDYERTRSDDGTVAHFSFTVQATLEDGQATVTIGGVRFLIDLDAGSMTRR